MAYFSNSTDGSCFDEQCGKCRYADKGCPIYFAQLTYNYAACNNETATKILDLLVKDDGTCAMFALDPSAFEIPRRRQGDLLT